MSFRNSDRYVHNEVWRKGSNNSDEPVVRALTPRTPFVQDSDFQLYVGDVREQLRQLPDESVHCVVTSPPYWGLRMYLEDGHESKHHELGLEPTPEQYVANMVDVFREVRRVLRRDGTCWMNLGDSYATTVTSDRHFTQPTGPDGTPATKHPPQFGGQKTAVSGLKPKDLCGIPWRVAFALQQPYYTGRIKDERDRTWLAAMVDAEGCMFIHKRKVGQSNGQGYVRKNDSYGAGLEISSTDRSIVEKCMAIAGIGSICEQTPEQNARRKQTIYRWNVRSNECRWIISELYPHLVAKQHEARLVIGCPSSGEDARKAHESLKAIHNGQTPDIDFAPPESLWEPGWYLRSDVIWAKPQPDAGERDGQADESARVRVLVDEGAAVFLRSGGGAGAG
jgi:hypothetical protein